MSRYYKGNIPKEKEWILRLSDLVKKEGFFDVFLKTSTDVKILEECGFVKNIDMERAKYISFLGKKYLHK